MKKWIPAAHSSQRFLQKSSTDTISPTLYTKSASLPDTASVYFSFPSIDVISITSALSQRHFLRDALLRLASSGIFSFTILSLLHFFHPVNSPFPVLFSVNPCFMQFQDFADFFSRHNPYPPVSLCVSVRG